MTQDAAGTTPLRRAVVDATRLRPTFLELLDGVEVVCFDFFDTLVTRRVAQPTHVFAQVEEQARAAGIAVPLSWARRRVEVERLARRRAVHQARRGDVSLDEIYRTWVWLGEIGEADAASLQELEVTLEHDAVTIVPAVRALWDGARRRGLPTIIVSDTYLSSDMLRSLGRRSGIDGIDEVPVFASSEHPGTKHNGLLWDLVVGAAAVDPQRMLHVGDNDEADDLRPSQRGIRTLRWGDLDRSHREPLETTPGLLAVSRLHAADRDAIVERWTAGELGVHPATLPVASTLAILLGAFVTWLERRVLALGAQSVHFAARDGLLVSEAWGVLREHRPELPPGSYLEVSRRTTQLARLTRLDARALRFVTSGRNEPLPLRDFVDRIGLALDDLPAGLLEPLGGRDALVHPADPRLAHLFRALEPHAIALGGAMRERLAAYLRQCGLTQPGLHVVVDLGWQGNLVAALAEVLDVEGLSDGRLAGLFLGLLPGAWASRPKAWLEAFAVSDLGPPEDHALLHAAIPVLERLFSAGHGVVWDYEVTRDGVTPRRHENAVERADHDGVVRPIQQRALVRLRELLDGGAAGVRAPELTWGAARSAVRSLALDPTLDEIDLLGRLHHVDTWDHRGEGKRFVPEGGVPPSSADVERLLPTLPWPGGALRQWEAQGHRGAAVVAEVRRRHPALARVAAWPARGPA